MEHSDLTVLQQADVLAEIQRRHGENPQQFAMSAKRDQWPVVAMAEQLACRQKADQKIPSWLSLDVLLTAETYEQASSEWTARSKCELFSDQESMQVLDVCGGLGVDAFAFASAGHRVHYNDMDPLKVALAEWNAQQLSVPLAKSSATDALSCLRAVADASLDLVLIDPSRRKDGQRVLSLAEYRPNLEDLWPELERCTRFALIKLAPGVDAAALSAVLPHYQKMFSVSLDGEAKERLVFIDFNNQAANTERQAVCLRRSGERQLWSQVADHTDAARADAGLAYLYDPDPAILLAGLGADVANQFNLQVLSSSHLHIGQSHALLLCSDQLQEGFPGRVFQVQTQIPFQRKQVRKYLKNNGIERAHVWRCQTKSSVKDLRRLLGIVDGDQASLLVYRDHQDREQFMHLQRLAP